jgi:GDSL-like Lipase/Acylhydrolase family
MMRTGRSALLAALPLVLAVVVLLGADDPARGQSQVPPLEFATSPDVPDHLAGPSQYQVAPTQVFFGAGGGLFINGIRWEGWGGALASGRGKARLRGPCKPDCAHAKLRKVPAKLYLFRVVEFNGHRQYLCWQLKFLKGRHRGRLGAENCRPPTIVGPPPPPDPISYVGLGDSYSSGEGVRPYLPGSDTPDDRCHRSAHAYSRQLRLPGLQIGERLFFACSGATTDHVLTVLQHPGEIVPQLKRAGIGADTDLVTITVGGDDAHFAKVLRSCALPHQCWRGKRRAKIVADVAAVGPRVLKAFREIYNKARNATIVVLGYPHLFPPGGSSCFKLRLFPRVARRFLNEMGVELNKLIAGSAAAAGVHYDDVAHTFRGHEICGGRGEWISGLTLPRGTDKLGPGTGSFHPTLAGQRAYSADLQGFLVDLIQSGAPLNSAGLPANPGRPPNVP